MAEKPPEGPLTDMARAIGSTLGQAKIQADQVLEGVKAMAKAGAEAYVRGGTKKTSTNKKKRTRAKSKSATGSAGKKNSRRKRSR
jgi:hypothetical protein